MVECTSKDKLNVLKTKKAVEEFDRITSAGYFIVSPIKPRPLMAIKYTGDNKDEIEDFFVRHLKAGELNRVNKLEDNTLSVDVSYFPYCYIFDKVIAGVAHKHVPINYFVITCPYVGVEVCSEHDILTRYNVEGTWT